MVLNPPGSGKMSNDRLRRVMGIAVLPRASAIAEDRFDDWSALGDMGVVDPFLSCVGLRQGGDVTMAILVFVKRGASKKYDKVHGWLAQLVQGEPERPEEEEGNGLTWKGDVFDCILYLFPPSHVFPIDSTLTNERAAFHYFCRSCKRHGPFSSICTNCPHCPGPMKHRSPF